MSKWLADYTSASISGICGIFIGHPLDTIKTRMQSNPLKYKNAYNSLITIVKEESIKGLFKGVTPPMLNQFPVNALLFSEYYRMMRIIDKYLHNRVSNGKKYFLSGCYSGLYKYY